jgi:hypothetical protein
MLGLIFIRINKTVFLFLQRLWVLQNKFFSLTNQSTEKHQENEVNDEEFN